MQLRLVLGGIAYMDGVTGKWVGMVFEWDHDGWVMTPLNFLFGVADSEADDGMNTRMISSRKELPRIKQIEIKCFGQLTYRRSPN